MRRQLMFVASLVLLMAPAGFADYVSTVKEGNKAFQQKDYKKALDCYHQAEPDLPVSPELDYNLGAALHGTGDYDEAIKKFQAAMKSTDPNVQAEAQYDLGNTYYRKKDFQNAINAYQESLKLNPSDMDSKFNLELARKMLKEQIKPQNNQQNKQDQKQQNQQNQQQKDQQKQQQQGQGKKMSKEDAERILNALKDDEQDLQKKIRRENAKGDYVGKDW